MSLSVSGLCQYCGASFHHHAVLVQRLVDGRDLALAEGVVERGVDRRGLMPRRAAASRSKVTRGLQALVLLVGVDVGEFGQAATAPRARAAPRRAGRRGRRPAACTGTAALLCRPPMRMSCDRTAETGWRPARAPACRAAGAITWSADALRSASGLSVMNMKPPLRWPPPVNAGDVLHRRVVLDDGDERRPAWGASPGTKCSGRPGSSRS